MKRTILFFSTLLLFGCGNNLGYNELIELGKQAELDGNYQIAINYYKRAIKVDSTKAKPYSLLAGSIVKHCPECPSDIVLKHLNKAYAIDSTEEVTIFNLAYVNGRLLNDYSTSIDFYSKLIDLKTDSDTIAMIKANRANMFLRLGDTLSYCSDIKATLEQINHEQLENNYLLICQDYLDIDMSITVLLDSNNKVDTIIRR